MTSSRSINSIEFQAIAGNEIPVLNRMINGWWLTMNSRQFLILIILCSISVIAGCKVAVIVPSGGDVVSQSGSRNCAGGNLCEFNVTDKAFSESFTAVARPGYVFSRWNSGPGFLCGASVNPVCVVSNTGLPTGNADIDAVIAGGSFFYAMPLFEFVGIDTDGDGINDHLDADDDNDGVLDADDACPLVGPNANGLGCPASPITDTVLANGKVWAQVAQFANLSWNQINAACPAGVCGNSALLNGYVMSGWRWASVADVNALFNFYIGSAQLGPGPSQYNPSFAVCYPVQLAACPLTILSVWPESGKFLAIDTDFDSYQYVTGWVSDATLPMQAYKARAGAHLSGTTVWGTNLTQARTLPNPSTGAWFYRTP